MQNKRKRIQAPTQLNLDILTFLNKNRGQEFECKNIILNEKYSRQRKWLAIQAMLRLGLICSRDKEIVTEYKRANRILRVIKVAPVYFAK